MAFTILTIINHTTIFTTIHTAIHTITVDVDVQDRIMVITLDVMDKLRLMVGMVIVAAGIKGILIAQGMDFLSIKIG